MFLGRISVVLPGPSKAYRCDALSAIPTLMIDTGLIGLITQEMSVPISIQSTSVVPTTDKNTAQIRQLTPGISTGKLRIPGT